jgi:hypothetical protein
MQTKISYRAWFVAAALAVLVSVGVGRSWVVNGCLPLVTPRLSVADINPQGEVLVTTTACLSAGRSGPGSNVSRRP